VLPNPECDFSNFFVLRTAFEQAAARPTKSGQRNDLICTVAWISFFQKKNRRRHYRRQRSALSLAAAGAGRERFLRFSHRYK